MRHRLVVVLLVALVAGAATPLGAATSEPPEPVLVVPGGEADDRLTVRPPTQTADERGRLTWTVANGGADPVRLELSLHEVISRAGQVEVGARHDRLALLDDELLLAPGEVGRIRLPVPEGTGAGTVALVARATDGGARVTGLALIGDGSPVRPTVERADARTGTVTVRLRTRAPALVDVAVRAIVWPGLVRDERVVTDVLVPAGGRDVPVVLGGPVAGRVTIEVAVSGQGGRTTRAVWWWPRWVVGGVAVVLLLATTLLLVAVRRRVRGAAG